MMVGLREWTQEEELKDLKVGLSKRLTDEQVLRFAGEFTRKLELPHMRHSPWRPYLIGVVNRPGTGGTTVARQLSNQLCMQVVEADDIRRMLGDLDVHDNIRRIGEEVVGHILRRGIGVVMDDFAQTKADRSRLKKIAASAGVNVYFIGVLCDPIVAIMRALDGMVAPISENNWRYQMRHFADYLTSITQVPTQLSNEFDLDEKADGPVEGVWCFDNGMSREQLSVTLKAYANMISQIDMNR